MIFLRDQGSKVYFETYTVKANKPRYFLGSSYEPGTAMVMSFEPLSDLTR